MKINYPEFLKSKKRKEREKIERKNQEKQDRLAYLVLEEEIKRREQILSEYRLIKEKKSKLSRRERDNFLVELHALIKKGVIQLDEEEKDI